MTYTRYKPDDWVVEVITTPEESDTNVSYNSVVFDNILWTVGKKNASIGRDTIRGYNLFNGKLEKEIDILSATGFPMFAGDFQLDSNNKIWFKGSANTLVGVAFVIFDPVTEVVSTLFTETATTYNGSVLRFDPVNNLMWVDKTATTISGINVDTLTEVRTITISTGSKGGWAVDTDKGHIWVRDLSSPNTLKVYNGATGGLLSTLSTTEQGGVGRITYFSEIKSMLINVPFVYSDLWSTVTNTKTASRTPATFDHREDIKHYHSVTGRFIADVLDTSNDELYLGMFDINLVEQDQLTSSFFNNDVYTDVTYVDQHIYVGGVTIDAPSETYYLFRFGFNIDGCYQPTDPSLYTGQSDVFNREIVFDLDLGAFFVNDFGYTDSAVRINDYVSLPMYTQSNPDTNVLVGSDHVIITSGEEVVVPGYEAVSRIYNPRGERFKYLATSATGVSLVEYNNFSFRDYESMDGDGFPFASYLLTGYDLSGDMMKKKRSIYLIVYCERTEKTYTLTEDGVVLSVQSGCIVQSQWEWANSAATGRWGRPFQAYRLLRPQPSNPQAGDILDYGERVIVTKNKLRGSGRSLSLFIQAECSKDLKLLGWGLDMTRQDFV